MDKKVRVGVIGTGWWSTEYHIPGLISNPEAELVAVSDIHTGRLEKTAQVYNIQNIYNDYREMLSKEQLDAVIIVTPHATHYQIASDCLSSNLHILLEKPMTLYAQEAKNLVDLADERGLQIMIGYTFHQYKQAQIVKDSINTGNLGVLEYLSCVFSSNMSGILGGNMDGNNDQKRFAVHGPSEFYNRPEMLGGGHGHLQLTHPIGYLMYISGLRVAKVQAVMSKLGFSVDMVDAISVEFDNGAAGLIGGTGNSRSFTRMSVEIFGSKGCYVLDTLSHFATLKIYEGKQKRLGWKPIYQQRSAVTQNFVETIQGKSENRAPGKIGWHAVELLDAAYRSAKDGGRPVYVEELYK